MRDLETVSLALTAAETGHLVFGTLHTSGAPSTINRIIDVFPPEQQAQIRAQISTSLKMVVTQRLFKTKDCLLYTSPSPRDQRGSRMPSSA